jgi:hypothetical protein
MLVEILPNGIGSEPILLEASLVVVRMDDGTPVMVSGEFGPEGVIRSSHALDRDFQTTIRQLGVDRAKISEVKELVLPKPAPGAKLIAGPGS